jgi:hypothetical protein
MKCFFNEHRGYLVPCLEALGLSNPCWPPHAVGAWAHFMSPCTLYSVHCTPTVHMYTLRMWWDDTGVVLYIYVDYAQLMPSINPTSRRAMAGRTNQWWRRTCLAGRAVQTCKHAVQCSAVQCSAVQCSAVQCSAVQCSAAPGRLGRWIGVSVRRTLSCAPHEGDAVQCRAMQCSAVQCSAVQVSAVQCSAVQQCSAVHFTAVQQCKEMLITKCNNVHRAHSRVD